MKSCATNLSRLIGLLLLSVGGCLTALAQEKSCNLPGVEVKCEKGQQALCEASEDRTKVIARCVTESPTDKTADQSLREQQGGVPQKGNPAYSATARYLAGFPLDEWILKYHCPLKTPYRVDTEWKYRLRRLALSLLEEGKYKEAVDALNKGMQGVDDAEECLGYLRAVAQAGAGDYRDAEVTILQITPAPGAGQNTFRLQELLGDVLFDQGKYSAAEQQYRKVQESWGKGTEERPGLILSVREGLVAALLAQGKYADAEALTEAVAKTSAGAAADRMSTAWDEYKEGLLQLRLGKYPGAEESFKEALRIDPSNLVFREALERARARK
jgi:tetratricopeptide (TPR) repeat protein